MENTTPAELVLELRNLILGLRTLTRAPVLDCLNAIREIPQAEWEQFLASAKTDPGLLGAAPDIARRFPTAGAYRRMETPPHVIGLFRQVLEQLRFDQELSDSQRLQQIAGAFEMASHLIRSYPKTFAKKSIESRLAELKAVLESG